MREALERRLAELSLEIRNYPTPIARCDEQLLDLLEKRSLLLRELEDMQKTSSSCSPLASWTNDGGFNAA